MLKSEKINFKASKISPNPLEVTFWIDLTENPQGTVWKWFDPADNLWKVLLLGNQEGSLDAYTKAESDLKFATNSSVGDLANQLIAKQDQLVDGVNIKTFNGNSLLGEGNIELEPGLNKDQVQSLIDESTKDFITVEETEQYVQEELDKVKVVVLDNSQLTDSLRNLLSENKVDFNSLKEDLAVTSNVLLYIDANNGLYRLTYDPNSDQILYTQTTVDKGNLVQTVRVITSSGITEQTVSKENILNYTDNVHDGITISNTEDNKTNTITLYNRGPGDSYLADDGTYKVLGSINLYTSMDRLPDCLAVLMDDKLVELNRFLEAKQYLTKLNDNVYLLLTDVYNESTDSRTIEGNQLYTFHYDDVSDSIYIIGSINPLYQIYNSKNPQPDTTEVTQITNTAKIIRRRISSGVYGNSNGLDIVLEDNKFDSVDNPNGTTTSRSINIITEGNGKDVLFNDGEYHNLQDSIDFSNYLAKDNTEEYTPTGNYNPATKKYVDDELAGLVDSAPEALDTLNELAAALNDNPNFATDIINLISTKANSSEVGDVNSLQTDSKTIVGAINEHESQINQQASQISDINEQLDNIGDYSQDITNIENNISIIQNNINTITNDISEIETKNQQQDTEIASKFELPTGGTAGQVLKKQTDGTVNWANDNDTVTTWDNLSGKPTLATVATTGSYNDLDDKPTIPPATSVEFEADYAAGTKIGTININGTSTDIYAPTSEGGGSTVTYTPTVTSGVQLGTIVIDGVSKVIYAPEDEGSDVTWSATQTSGTKIGTLNVDGTDYVLYAPTPTTYNNATTTQSGLMSSTDKSKLDGIRAGADSVEWSGALSTGTNIGTLKINDSSYNIYAPTAGESVTYDKATETTLGLVKIGYPEEGKNYPIELNDSGQMYVNVPWTDTNTTYSVATTTTDGLMSSEDKTKLDSISSDYNLPIASTDTLGGIKIGNGLEVESDGTVNVSVATTTTLGGVKSTDSPYQVTSTKNVYHYYNDGGIIFHLVGSIYCSNSTGTSSGDYFDPANGTSEVDKVYNTPFPIDDTITDLFPDNLTYTTCSVAIEIPGLADEELYENTYLKVLCNLNTPPYSTASNDRREDYLVFADSNSYYVADFKLLTNGIGVTTFSLKGYITPTCINYLNTHTNVKAYYVCLCSYKQVIEDSQYTYSDAYSNVNFDRRPSIGGSEITSNTKVTGYAGIQGFYDTLRQIDPTADDCPNLEYVLYEINNSEADTPEVNSYYVTVEDSGKMRVDTPSAFEYITLKQGDEGFTVEIEDGSGITEAYVKVYIPSKYTQKYNYIKIEDLVVKYSLECDDKYHSGMIVASYKHPIQYGSTWGEEELIPVYFAPQGTLSQPRTIFVNCYKTVTQATGGYSAMMQFSTPQESSYSLTAITVVQVYMNLICYN